MVFSSLEFVCVFFPIVFLLYCMMPGIRFKNAFLIVASLLFYSYGEPAYVLLMVVSAVFNYIFARFIAGSGHKKLFLFADAAANIFLLFFFKYLSFFVEIWSAISGCQCEGFDMKLPVGISFFTFQALSYVIDVYFGKIQVQKNFWKVLLYISFFPQLVAGPIVRYRDINMAIESRKMDIRQIADGVRRFICGLGKKVLIANTMGRAADAVFSAGSAEINIVSAWIGAIAYMLQIYYDFSGYSDMAIGLGRMYGFRFQENFRYPYGAASIKEFWRRWHISLSSWFKEYLYIPLGGNRKGKLRTGINKLIVFFCTGLWHGANWTFIIWGLYHGLFAMLEEYVRVLKKIPRCVAYIYTMLVVCVGFVMFRADTVTQGIYMITQMFIGISYERSSMSFAASQLTPWFIVMLAVGIIGMAPIRPVVSYIQNLDNSERKQVKWANTVLQVWLYALSVLLLVFCIIRLSGNSYNPFIYFRF